jgi:hypothetical protein
MKKFLKQHADNSERTMETGNHSKNGVNLQNLSSRGINNKLKVRIKSILFVLMLSIASVMLNSCKEDKGEDNTPIEEKVEQAYQEIKATADAILLSDDPVAGFEAIAEQYRAMEEVQTVQTDRTGLFIQFIDGCITGWLISQPIDNNFEIESIMKLATKAANDIESKNSDKKILFINQQFSDTHRTQFIYMVNTLCDIFDSLGWKATQINGADADIDFHKEKLSGFDLIFDISHGAYIMEKIWILTGEESRFSMKDLYYEFFKQGKICKLTVEEYRANDTAVLVEYYAISQDFIKNAYPANAFSGSLIYMVPCQSMGHGTGTDKNQSNLDLSMAEVFVDHGKAAAYVGWDETNYSGQRAGWSIMLDLLEGKTLSAAVEHLEDRQGNWRVDYDNEENDDIKDEYYTATLRYYPSTADDYCFFDKISSYSFADGTVTLEKNIDYTDYRTNADGGKFYKTTLALEVETDGIKWRSKIETDENLYTNLSKGMNPCMLIDIDKKIISVFTNSKTPNNDYTMDGFVYRIDANSKTWQKETVFAGTNFGWYSFFGGSDNGNPELWHFSYAGYFALLSKRTEQGTWSTQNKGSINANLADKQYYSHKNILISSSAGVDYMSFKDDSRYDNLTGFSNSPSTLISGITVVKDILGNN